ncbi:MAG: PilZ domain-containing protein [Leptospiraceae bacterium]|nr:PilZ domain-containing protein [Leptospiraceae bacterium]
MEATGLEWAMEEKRKFPRADLVFRIEYRPLKEESAYLGMTRDLSLGGVSIRTEQGLEKGAPVALSFSFPELEGSIQATARVVRSWQEGEHTYTALKFTAVLQDDLEILQEHINQYYSESGAELTDG